MKKNEFILTIKNIEDNNMRIEKGGMEAIAFCTENNLEPVSHINISIYEINAIFNIQEVMENKLLQLLFNNCNKTSINYKFNKALNEFITKITIRHMEQKKLKHVGNLNYYCRLKDEKEELLKIIIDDYKSVIEEDEVILSEYISLPDSISNEHLAVNKYCYVELDNEQEIDLEQLISVSEHQHIYNIYNEFIISSDNLKLVDVLKDIHDACLYSDNKYIDIEFLCSKDENPIEENIRVIINDFDIDIKEISLIDLENELELGKQSNFNLTDKDIKILSYYCKLFRAMNEIKDSKFSIRKVFKENIKILNSYLEDLYFHSPNYPEYRAALYLLASEEQNWKQIDDYIITESYELNFKLPLRVFDVLNKETKSEVLLYYSNKSK